MKGSQFRKVMKESGLDDHPAVIRVFGGSVKKVLAANRGKAPGLSAIEMVERFALATGAQTVRRLSADEGDAAAQLLIVQIRPAVTPTSAPLEWQHKTG